MTDRLAQAQRLAMQAGYVLVPTPPMCHRCSGRNLRPQWRQTNDGSMTLHVVCEDCERKTAQVLQPASKWLHFWEGFSNEQTQQDMAAAVAAMTPQQRMAAGLCPRGCGNQALQHPSMIAGCCCYPCYESAEHNEDTQCVDCPLGVGS